MSRPFLLSCLTASTLLLASPVLAGGDGSAGGNSGFSPIGASSLTSVGTASFDVSPGSTVVVPAAAYAAALAQALSAAGLDGATTDGVQALLTDQSVNGISPQQAAAALAAQLQAAGAGPAEAQALVAALAELGASPSIPNLTQAVDAFNAMVSSAEGTALQALASTISPIRAYLISVIENVTVVAG